MHTSKDAIAGEKLVDGYESWLVDWGEYTAYFERIAAGLDFTAYYDSCDCPHWGYVLKGKLRFVYNDGAEEDVAAGEMYYVPPGHKFYILEDAETVEFSPTAALQAHMQKVARNLEAMGDAGPATEQP